MHRLLLENEDINHNLNLTERYTKNRASNYLNIVSDSKEPKDNNNSVKYYKYQNYAVVSFVIFSSLGFLGIIFGFIFNFFITEIEVLFVFC